MKLDTSDIRRAIHRLAAETKRANKDIAQEAARGFVRDIVKVTPPGSAKTSGSAAKKQGEQAVEIGIAMAMVAASKGTMGPLENPASVHARARSKRTGRVDRRTKAVPVDAAMLRSYLKQAKALVGLLAGGWNAAAEKLGVKLPAWVRRHGAGRGQCSVRASSSRFSITVTNSVAFVGNVKDYERRMKWSIRNQARKMDRRADFLIRKALRKAGWR